MEPWHAAITSAALMALGLACHRRVRAVLPEDPPSALGRHHHLHPTPMAGVIPALLAMLAFAVLAPSGWLLAAVALTTAVGYLDDRGKSEGQEMRWYTKGLGILVATACATVHVGLHHPQAEAQWLWVLVWLFAVTNAVNFMDNTDGVAAAAGGLGLLLASAGEGPMAFVGMAFLGFLVFNWPNPLAFLGDSGSLCLGVCLGVASLDHGARASGELLHLTSLAPMVVFGLDFVQVIVARLILGVPPWEGDRRHLTHVMIHLGVPRLVIAPAFAGLAWLGYQLLA